MSICPNRFNTPSNITFSSMSVVEACSWMRLINCGSVGKESFDDRYVFDSAKRMNSR